MKKYLSTVILCLISINLLGQAKTIITNKDGFTVLMAKDADLKGGLKPYRLEPFKAFWVENWGDSKQTFTWNLSNAKEGIYKVNLLYKAAKGISGDAKVTLELTANGEKTIQNMPLYAYWERRQFDQTVKLAKGNNTLTLRLASDAGIQLQLYSVELIRPQVEKQILARAAKLHSRPQWVKDAKYGFFFHWNSKSQPQKGEAKTYNDAVTDFDVAAFAKTVADCGADFIIFTTSWAGHYFPAPLQSIDKILPGRTTQRDLVSDLSTELSKYGIKLMLYYHVANGDKEWWEKQNFNSPEVGNLYKNVQSIFEEIGTRYKDKVAGLFIDDGIGHYPHNAPFEAITNAAKKGNKDLIVAYNPWILPKLTVAQDYYAGEFGINMETAKANDWDIDDEGYFTSGPQTGLKATFCGLLEPGDWTHTGKDTDIPPPYFTSEKLIEIIQTAIARKNTPVINVSVYQDGRIGEKSFNLLKKLNYAVHNNDLQAQTQYFVSPVKGEDSNNGTLQSPFKTIAKAQDIARQTHGETTIFLREGDYRLQTPLVFTPQDGDDDKSLTIRPYNKEKAVIKGSVVLENLQWEPYEKGILKAEVKGLLAMDMLLVNGEIRHQARYPNFDANAIRFNGTAADATDPKRVKNWKNPAGGYLHAMHLHDWGDFHYRITGKDEKDELKMEGGWQNNRKSGLHKENRMVENIFEELDAPGEWFYQLTTDNQSPKGTLYYYPLPNEDVNAALFECPQLKHLIEVRGNEANPVRNITIEGIDLTQTVRTFMEEYEPLLRSDWTVYRGGAVIFEGAEHCGLKNCNLYNLGGNAVFFNNYNRNCEVSGSHLTNIGASAVCFVGDPDAVRSPSFEYSKFVAADKLDRSIGPKTNNYPADCRVHDNLIHKIGLYEKQITGVELSMCRAITVSHNSVYDTPRAGINISEGTWGGHIIEFNDVFNTVKETGDHGSFNSWGRDRYWHPSFQQMESLLNTDHKELILADAIETTIIRNNRFRCDRGWDIDLDDGSSNYHIYNNLCLNGGLKLREGFYRIVENNILINSSLHRHVWFRNNGNVFIRNIVTHPYPKPIGSVMQGTLIDYNIFPDSAAYRTALKYGTDSASTVANVKFVNPTEGDFSIDISCTDIFLTGFQNFDMNNFGVASKRLKSIAEKPRISVPVFLSDKTTSGILTWESVQIKNLETLGERSATGMDSERGVYVVAVGAYGNELRDYLKSNDVILGFAGKAVNNIDDLRKAVAAADLSQPQKIIVFRSQKENTIVIPGNIIKSNIKSVN